jgi:hypothetical protein
MTGGEVAYQPEQKGMIETKEGQNKIIREYGSLRKYRKVLRARGDYRNPSEQLFKELCDRQIVSYHRRGYPDFMILRQNEIIGFIEVKPRGTKSLRPGQGRFKRFCERYKIPFAKWTPDDPLPEWIN